MNLIGAYRFIQQGVAGAGLLPRPVVVQTHTLLVYIKSIEANRSPLSLVDAGRKEDRISIATVSRVERFIQER